MTPLEKYKSLIRQAEYMDSNASPDATGGPSHWNRLQEATDRAFAELPYEPGGFPPETAEAISSVKSNFYDAIWAAAAKNLRDRAKRQLEALQKQREELDGEIAKITEA